MNMVEALQLRLLPWSPILCDDDDEDEDEDDDDFDFESYGTPGGY